MLIKTDVLKAALLFAGKKDVRYYLNGVCFESGPGGVRLLAADGHRMLILTLAGSEGALPPGSFIVPRELVESAARLKTPQLQLDIEDGNATFTGMGATLSGALVDGRYPDVDRVVPTLSDKPAGCNFQPEYLADALKASKLLGHPHEKKQIYAPLTAACAGDVAQWRFDCPIGSVIIAVSPARL